jgi:hypothetical protein
MYNKTAGRFPPKRQLLRNDSYIVFLAEIDHL